MINIHLFPQIGDPPQDFDAQFVEDVGVECSWGMYTPNQYWIGYDDGVNAGGIGLSGGEFHAAIRWDAGGLIPYSGMPITAFKFFPLKFANDSDITFKIWEDTNASILVYEQVLENLNWNEWNTIFLDEPHSINPALELWVGFYVNAPNNEDPIGHDDGPAVTGYGDLISLDGTNWESLSNNYGLDFNYNLQILVEEDTELIFKTIDGDQMLEFLGINIYRDGNLVNSALIEPGIEDYIDPFFDPGTWTYTAKAVYDLGLSAPTQGVDVIIPIGPQISVSPQELVEIHNNFPQITTRELTINNTGDLPLEWNATVTINGKVNSNIQPVDPSTYEGLLEARMAADGLTAQGTGFDQSPVAPRNLEGNQEDQWDVLYSFSAQAASCQAVATDGEHFYMTYWNGAGEFDKFDMSGNYIESFTIASAAAIRDFAYDGQYFYGAPGGGMSIAQLDLANQTAVSTITISGTAGVTGSRHLAYDPELDGGNGGFWLGQWGELAAVDMSGNTIYSNSETPNPSSCYGSAYDPYSTPGSPKLWLFTQNAVGSPNDLLLLEEFDIATLSFTGNTFDIFSISGNIPGYIPGTAGSQTIAGGLDGYVDASNTFVFAANIQQSPNLVVGLEVATAGPQPTTDVGVQGITSPNSGMALTNAEPVTFNIKNYGTDSQSNIPWEITWDGPTGSETVNGTFTGTLASGESAEIDAGTADLSVLGDYDFEACTSLAGDENTGNDCKTKTVTHAFPEYCDASTTTEDEWIANVLCGTIDNSSGWQGGVADYTDISTTIEAGMGEAITITNGNAWASDVVTIWVDWNMDYEFGVGTDEEFFTTNVGGTGETFEGEILVPAGTPDGEYRMRVRMTYASDPQPCGNSSYGEVEDYTIVVGGGVDPWLMVSPENGTIGGGDSETLTVTFNSDGFAYGTYGTISIASNDPVNPQVEIPVTLYIVPLPPTIIFEPFEDYNANDYLVQQAVAQGKEYWTTWSNAPGGAEDPYVTDAAAYAGSNSMVIEGTNDAVLLLNETPFTSGMYEMDFYVYIPTGKVGYFNTLQLFDGTASEWGMQAFFDVNGSGLVDAGGAGAGAFTYTYDTWYNVHMMVDLDADNAQMYLNGDMIVEWQWSTGSFGTGTINELHAMNFYAWADNGTPGAHFDNVDISNTGGDPEMVWTPDEFEFTYNPYGVETQELYVSNEGLGDLICDMSITYGYTANYQGIPPHTNHQYATNSQPEQFITTEIPGVTDAIVCPADAFFSQPAANFATAYTMDEDAGYSVYQSINVDALMTGIRFWTISAYFDGTAWSPCDGIDPRPFDIGLWADNGGNPGVNIMMYEDVMVNRIETGDMLAGIYPIHEYTVEFEGVTVAVGDWFSIQSKTGTAVNCWNLALNEPGGEGIALQFDGTTWTPQDEPLGFCLLGGEANSWLSIDPMGGTIAPGNQITFDVTADFLEYFGFGNYATIWIVSNDPYNDIVEIPVAVYPDMIEEEGINNAYVVMFPNPVNEVVNISTNHTISMVKVLNQVGQVVLEQEVSDKSVVVNTRSLDTGVYFVEITSEAGQSTHKLIVQ